MIVEVVYYVTGYVTERVWYSNTMTMTTTNTTQCIQTRDEVQDAAMVSYLRTVTLERFNDVSAPSVHRTEYLANRQFVTKRCSNINILREPNVSVFDPTASAI